MKTEIDYPYHLSKVSRSFAVAISFLKEPLKEYVSISYLLFRVLDTVEDAIWADPAQQKKSFEDFLSFLKSDFSLVNLETWKKNFPSKIPEHEKNLIAISEKIFQRLNELPTVASDVIKATAKSMTQGMSFYCDQKNKNLKITSVTQLNQYCIFVAGIIGELLENLYAITSHQAKLNIQQSKSKIIKALHFGIFLQKINILKDQFQDEKEGRFFISDRKNVLSSLKFHIQQSLDYLKSIAQPDFGYRMFCGFSFFLALLTVPVLTQSKSEFDINKISKSEVQDLILQLQEKIHSNQDIDEIFNFINPKIDSIDQASALKRLDTESLFHYYDGALSQQDWDDLIKT